MFTIALFLIAKFWNQPKCPTTDEQKKKTYIYTMAYDSVIKNEIIWFAGKWMKLEIVLNKVRQTQNPNYHMF
jgi:hypothetical protein